MNGGFVAVDWIVLAGYLLVVLALGAAAARRAAGTDEFFLAGRSMPMWAVALSVVATSLSAATFIGGPQQAFTSDLTYFSANLGGLIAVVIVATLFVPAYYRLRVTSVYELVGRRYGPAARTGASAMFMVGRVFASGARLFMVALPFSLVAFGSTETGALIGSIAIIALGATAYTIAGGIRAVIWTDVLQVIVVVGTILVAVILLIGRLPLTGAEMLESLRAADDGDKLRVLDLGLDPAKPFTLWTALIGFTIFNVAAFGTDQDLAQRLLTCRNARASAWSVILSNLIAWPVVLLFLAMGLLLWLFVHHPAGGGAHLLDAAGDDTRQVFLWFILLEMPPGLRGLMMAGLFAAAMSSLDSALNAMASTTIVDFWRPHRLRRDGAAPIGGDRIELRASRFAIAAWAIVLAGFASFCVWWQQASGRTLIAFALSVMVFAYAGLLGVYASALLTRRGSAASAVAALVTGFAVVLAFEVSGVPVAFPWRMTIASAASFVVCIVGKNVETSERREENVETSKRRNVETGR